MPLQLHKGEGKTSMTEKYVQVRFSVAVGYG